MLLLPCAIKSSWFISQGFSHQTPSHRVLPGLGLLQLSGIGGVRRAEHSQTDTHPKNAAWHSGLVSKSTWKKTWHLLPRAQLV